MNRGLSGALSTSVAIALIAGCGGSRPPIGAPGVMPQSPAAGIAAGSTAAQLTSQDLIYVSAATGARKVSVYSYATRKHQFSLSLDGSAYGECVDKKGNVFITTRGGPSVDTGIIYEFAHGAKEPIATLSDPGSPNACSVDSITGNLAVTNDADHNNPNGNGDLVIYANGTGSPTVFTDSAIVSMLFCGYDPDGNLFVDGRSDVGTFRLFEVPFASNNLSDVNVDANIKNKGAVQWDGQYLTVASFTVLPSPLMIYRLQVYGSEATVVGKTTIKSRQNRFDGPLWINGNTVIAPTGKHAADVGFWAYPSGGKPTRQIKKVEPIVQGVVVSLASQHGAPE